MQQKHLWDLWENYSQNMSIIFLKPEITIDIDNKFFIYTHTHVRTYIQTRNPEFRCDLTFTFVLYCVIRVSSIPSKSSGILIPDLPCCLFCPKVIELMGKCKATQLLIREIWTQTAAQRRECCRGWKFASRSTAEARMTVCTATLQHEETAAVILTFVYLTSSY